jgi:hypothetical protein
VFDCAVHMKHKLTAISLAAIGLVCLGMVIGFCTRSDALARLERTRAALRKEGFRLKVTDFDLTISRENRLRAATLDDCGRGSYLLLSEAVNWLPTVGSSSALVMWNQPELSLQVSTVERCTNLWSDLRRGLNHTALEQACQALLAGSYRSLPPTVPVNRSATDTCRLGCPLAAWVMLALHEGDRARAWTNLFALTRLVAEWSPKPFHSKVYFYWRHTDLVRAYEVTWQALQAGGWTDAQLAVLQREWGSAQMRCRLSERVFFSRAYVERSCRHHEAGVKWPGLWALEHPGQAWKEIQRERTEANCRKTGSYIAEEALLRLSRDWEQACRRIDTCSNWAEMKVLADWSPRRPDVADLTSSFTTNSPGGRAILASVRDWLDSGLDRFGLPPLWRIADSEAMRQLLVTAIALERYRLHHGSYPESLASLVPGLLAAQPMDFTDGQPLRYRRTEDGRFILYSVGLDCTDHGGVGRKPERFWMNVADDHMDIVWPFPASPAEVGAESALRRSLPETKRPTFLSEP